jgi:hypothetical protein
MKRQEEIDNQNENNLNHNILDQDDNINPNLILISQGAEAVYI